MRRNLGPSDLGGLLEQPILAVLATRRSDESALLSPVWHEWGDGAFTVCIPVGDVKLAHIRSDPRVTILVAEHALPYRGIEVTGEAVLSADSYPAAMRRMARRYFGPGAEALYPDTAAGFVVRVDAHRVRCWDYADDVAAMQG